MQPRNVDDFKKQNKQRANPDSSWSVLLSVLLLPNAERQYTWFSNFKLIIKYIYQRFYFLQGIAETKIHVHAVSLVLEEGDLMTRHCDS